MKTLIVLILLIWAQVLHGAQVFTIPEGPTIYGPIAIKSVNLLSRFSFDRSAYTNPATTLTASLQSSTDGVTFNQFCSFSTQGGSPILTAIGTLSPIQDIATVCQAPVGTTHIRVFVVASGPISLSRAPRLEE